MVRAAVGHDAVAQPRADLVQQRARAADQRFERAFRIGAVLVRPQRFQKLNVGHGRAAVQDQVLNQARALLRFADQSLGLALVDIDHKGVHHLNANGILHTDSFIIIPHSPTAANYAIWRSCAPECDFNLHYNEETDIITA